MPSYDLMVNGEKRHVDAPEDMPLVWVLRDLLGMTGTKFGCGIAQCRACTVLVDGVETASCQLQMKDVGKAKILTIEGLAEQRSPGQAQYAKAHTIQEVWVQEDVPQCGYCQPGQILTTFALLSRNPKPSDADIDTAFSGNICRCGTYNRIRKAVHKAAEVMAKRSGK
jgi:aerobic-type carbon monoxide dehydrogenase small subunit (CoxS/CutS family)